MASAIDAPEEVPRTGSPSSAHATQRDGAAAAPRSVGTIRRPMQRLTTLLAVIAFAGACTKREGSPNPRAALDAYTAALEEGRIQDAYALLSAEAKRGMSPEAFERMVRENPSELRALLEALERPTADPYVTARVTAPDGETLLMVYEDGAWRVDASAVDLYGQTTPDQALRSFVRAYENRRYDVLLRFVPDAHREGLDADKLKQAWEGEQKEEMDRLVAALTAGLDETRGEPRVELVGDRATIAYGSAGTVELLREQGAWKIEDFR